MGPSSAIGSKFSTVATGIYRLTFVIAVSTRIFPQGGSAPSVMFAYQNQGPWTHRKCPNHTPHLVPAPDPLLALNHLDLPAAPSAGNLRKDLSLQTLLRPLVKVRSVSRNSSVVVQSHLVRWSFFRTPATKHLLLAVHRPSELN
jgi:hypothetical protein